MKLNCNGKAFLKLDLFYKFSRFFLVEICASVSKKFKND